MFFKNSKVQHLDSFKKYQKHLNILFTVFYRNINILFTVFYRNTDYC